MKKQFSDDAAASCPANQGRSSFCPTKWTLVFLLLSSTLILMGGAAVAPALPSISAAFPDASETMVSLIITLPSLAVALTGFLLGAFSDRIGRLPVLIGSILLFTVAGTSGYYLDSLEAILVGRFIVGIGIGGITTTITSLIAEYYSGITRTKVLGYQAGAMGIGALILETGGGFLAGVSWRISFLIYLIGAVILIGIFLTMREPKRECVPYQSEPGNPSAAAVLSVTELAILYVTLFLGVALFFLMPTKLPYLLSGLLGSDAAIISGVILGLMGVASMVASVNVWRIVRRVNRQVVIGLAFVCMAAGMLLLGVVSDLVPVVAAVAVIGFGNGLLMPSITMWLSEIVPMPVMGKATGGFSVSLNLGNFSSSLLAVPLLIVVGTYAGLFAVCGVAALGIGVIIVGSFWFRRRKVSV
ncbi:MFS transporter [Methanocorpusculum sp. MG]|uniref:MFS transporter n=1 Tax=Methanocorpusculum petauri TaxID=3002863 RepID=A0ABT4IIR0_9EURY|nr:MFS transporter [Methanocorpusculum petauri]MCZ0861147.1 MFS transporter [Methanocorpusculum petauri]MDE2444474.1 MFS transporter [Methanocorpusculum sp.]